MPKQTFRTSRCPAGQVHGDEVVTLVDHSGTVVGSAERSVVGRDDLLHAATAVLVRDSRARIYVHRRSPEKDWAPGAHDAAAGAADRR